MSVQFKGENWCQHERHYSIRGLLEAVDHLCADEHKALIEIIQRRIAERGRKRLAAEAQEARREFEEGHSGLVSVEELMNEALS